MSISASMQIGMNGLNIFRSATAVISQNIANVSTPGYSRQKAIIESAPTTNLSGFTLGSGAMISKLQRFHDALLQEQMANSETTLGYDSAKSTALQQIEPVFNDIGTDGIGASIAHFFAAWQDLTNNPGGMAERQSVLSNARILADDLHSTSKTLTDMISLQNASLTPVIDGINVTLKAIAKLNGQVTATEMVSGNANEVKDKRDLLLQELAKQIGITTTENSDGTTDVKLVGGDGYALVTGADFGTFSLDKTTDPNSFIVQLVPAKGSLPPKTPTIYTGSLGATLDLRDTIIPGYLAQLDTLATSLTTEINKQHAAGFDQSATAGKDIFNPSVTKTFTFALDATTNVVSGADVNGLLVGMQVTGDGIPDGAYIGSIPDGSSFTLVTATGASVLPEATQNSSLKFYSSKTKTGDLGTGLLLDNVVRNVDVTGLRVGMQVTGTGIPLVPPKTFIGTIDQSGSFTLVDADNIAVNAQAAAAGSTLTFPEGSASALFSINPSMTTFTVAASSQDTNAGDNINAVKIAGLNSQRLMSGTPPTLTFSGFWDALVSKMGLDVNSSKTNVAQDEAFNNQLSILKDTTSGVSLDQELSDMMMYQRSYQACAQVISTATAMMDVLLGIVR